MTEEDLYDEMYGYVQDNTISALMNVVNRVISDIEDWQAETIRLEMEDEYGEYKNKYMTIKRLCIND